MNVYQETYAMPFNFTSRRGSGSAQSSSTMTGRASKTGADQNPPKSPHVKVVRTLTMPDGRQVRVVRQDALDRAISKSSE